MYYPALHAHELVYVRWLGNTGAKVSWATHKRGLGSHARCSGFAYIQLGYPGMRTDLRGDVRGMCVGCAWDVRGMYAGCTRDLREIAREMRVRCA